MINSFELNAKSAEVLVVDDMATLRLWLAHHVEEMGHVVTSAANGREAWELLGRQRFDLVLLDLMMPEMGGAEVLQRMKADERLREIPVIMISGMADHDAAVGCIAAGAEDYLPKPCDQTLLRARIVACLERKRLWDELAANYRHLKQLEELRDNLMHMIVHDMRAPLTAVLTSLEMIDFVPDIDDATRAELMVMARRGGQTLLGMINDLLDISRMESGVIALEMKLLQPAPLFERALSDVAPLIADKGFALVRNFDGEAGFPGDEDKLRRVLINLLGNAIKFTPRGGTLTVGVTGHGSSVRFRVSDTGEGIPRESHGKIFEKFAQSESRLAGRRMSSGLGLTFCKLAVEAHGGRIGVDSEPGQGSTFWFDLPAK